jgi:hypothetical protein
VKTRIARIVLGAIVSLAVAGCATVDVTKTGKGAYAATNPNDIEILTALPRDRGYEEIATISTTQWNPDQTAKMHNALRAKAAPLGAPAVVLSNSGIDHRGYLWATGSAIRFKN